MTSKGDLLSNTSVGKSLIPMIERYGSFREQGKFILNNMSMLSLWYLILFMSVRERSSLNNTMRLKKFRKGSICSTLVCLNSFYLKSELQFNLCFEIYQGFKSV